MVEQKKPKVSADGGRNQAAIPCQECATVPANGGWSEGEAQPGRSPQRLADAGENDYQHRKHSGLQQQAEAGGVGDEAGGEQGGEPRHKKAALRLMQGDPSKINPPNSHPSNPIHKAADVESR